jgi:hypothetical protein
VRDFSILLGKEIIKLIAYSIKYALICKIIREVAVPIPKLRDWKVEGEVLERWPFRSRSFGTGRSKVKF